MAEYSVVEEYARLMKERDALRAALLDLATVAAEADPSIAAKVALATGRAIEDAFGQRATAFLWRDEQ